MADGFLMLPRAGLAMCHDPGDIAALAWLCGEAHTMDRDGWSETVEAKNSDLCAASGKNRGWCKSFLKRMVKSGVLTITVTGDHHTPREVLMTWPVPETDHHADRKRDRKRDRYEDDSEHTVDDDGPPRDPLTDPPTPQYGIETESRRVETESGSESPTKTPPLHGTAAGRRVWQRWHDLVLPNGEQPHKLSRHLTKSDSTVITSWLVEFTEQDALLVVDWSHLCRGSWHNQKGALNFATLFRADWSSASVEAALKWDAKGRPTTSSPGQADMLESMECR